MFSNGWKHKNTLFSRNFRRSCQNKNQRRLSDIAFERTPILMLILSALTQSNQIQASRDIYYRWYVLKKETYQFKADFSFVNCYSYGQWEWRIPYREIFKAKIMTRHYFQAMMYYILYERKARTSPVLHLVLCNQRRLRLVRTVNNELKQMRNKLYDKAT